MIVLINDAIDYIWKIPPSEISNTPTQTQVTDLFDENITKNSNNKHLPQTHEHDFLDLTTAQEQINGLKTEIVTSKEFILEQLYVFKKSVGDLKNQQQAPQNSPLFEHLKEEVVYLGADSKSKSEIIKILSENQCYKNVISR